jgi:sugar lactone lactonase YvrE
MARSIVVGPHGLSYLAIMANSQPVCDLGESPVWDPDGPFLYWVDITGGILHRLCPSTGERNRWTLGSPLAFAVRHEHGGLLVGRGTGVFHFDPATAALTPLLEVEGAPDLRWNDAKCDSLGRLWAGTMDQRPGHSTGTFYRIDLDRTCEPVLDGLGIPNGPCWSPDNSYFYLADSRRSRIARFRFDLAGGLLRDETEFARRPEGEVPDGAAIDEEGCLWSCQWDGWSVVRFAPDGSVIVRIRLPVARPTSCVFAGPDLRTLYITSARTGLTPAELREQPLAGTLLSIPASVAGNGPSQPARLLLDL